MDDLITDMSEGDINAEFEALYPDGIKNKTKDEVVFFLKACLRLFKTKLNKSQKRDKTPDLKKILYLTDKHPYYMQNSDRIDNPNEFITSFCSQCPNYTFTVVIPLYGLNQTAKTGKTILIETAGEVLEAEKTNFSSEFSIRNTNYTAVLYKFTKTESNIKTYGVFSEAFSYINSSDEFDKFPNKMAFLRAVRTLIKDFHEKGLNQDIIHSDKIPFFAGSEFESKFPSNIKVLQTAEDFVGEHDNKQPPFWSIINIADKKTLKKMCEDSYINRGLNALFANNLIYKNSKNLEKIEFLYKHYYSMISANTDDSEIERQNTIIKFLDARVRKLFQKNIFKEDMQYYPVLNSIRLANFWAVISKSYYEEIFENTSITPPKIYRQLIKHAEKSDYVNITLSNSDYSPSMDKSVYYHFDSENFRVKRVRNKNTLLRELSENRIKTNFVDPSLFLEKEYKIYGYLDYFFDAPVLYADLDEDVFAEGTDILFAAILKLLELNKNVKIILTSKIGMRSKYIKSKIDFLRKTSGIGGRWVFIDGRANFSKFMTGSDMYLAPYRTNNTKLKQVLAANYGCVPIVSKIGLSDDIIIDIFDDMTKGNGFKTKENLLDKDDNTTVYYDTLIRALEMYKKNPSSWNTVIKNCLKAFYSWDFKKLEKFDKIYSEKN